MSKKDEITFWGLEILKWGLIFLLIMIFGCRSVKKSTSESTVITKETTVDTTNKTSVKKEDGKTVLNDHGFWGRITFYPGGKIPDSIRRKIKINPIVDSIIKYNTNGVVDFSFGEYNRDRTDTFSRTDSSTSIESHKKVIDNKTKIKTTQKDVKSGFPRIYIIIGILALIVGIIFSPKLSSIFAIFFARMKRNSNPQK